MLLTDLSLRCTGLRLLDAWRTRAEAKGIRLKAESGFALWACAPVCNDQTVYSCVMQPAEGIYEARVVFKWEEYCREASMKAWESWHSTAAYNATKAMIMQDPNRGLHFPSSPQSVGNK